MKPLYAVLLPIIGGAWANSFGSLGAPWLALESVVDVPDPSRTLRLGALLVWIADLTGGMMIAWLYGRTWALRRGMSAILIISLLHGGLLVLLLPTLLPIAMLMTCAAGLAAALALSRWSFYRQEGADEPDRIFVRDEPVPPPEAAAGSDGARGGRSPMTLPVLPGARAARYRRATGAEARAGRRGARGRGRGNMLTVGPPTPTLPFVHQ